MNKCGYINTLIAIVIGACISCYGKECTGV